MPKPISYIGYGVDLGAFRCAVTGVNKATKKITSGFAPYAHIVLNDNLGWAVPFHTDSFRLLIYIPAVIPVLNPDDADPGTLMRLLEPTAANDLLFDTIKKLYEAADPELVKGDDTTEFFEALLKQFIVNNADFSYNRDWNDLI